MAIYYFDGNIIGRSSGRSAVGAALRSAAYRSGEGFRDGEIVHDYTRKGGVAHSEILLPEGAPPEYKDRETLWNAVEKSEKRKDAQLAREIIVALPWEFNLSEQLEVLRAFLQESFVKIGMCADFAIHDKWDGNPHAHIMLTTRHVSRDGFGKKNTDWNKKPVLLEWRKAWTHINNHMLERKGLDTRIDHRTLKEQGLNREPMIHMGHAATALERQGIRTERGDYNRKIKRRNLERVVLKKEAEMMEQQELMQGMMEMQKATMQGIRDLQQTQQETSMQILWAVQQRQTAKTPEHTETEDNAEPAPNELITKLKTANRMNETQDPDAPDKTPFAIIGGAET